MKKHSVFLISLLLAAVSWAQNTSPFPSTGPVGIGTTNPQAALHVYGQDPFIFIEGNGSSYYPGLRIKGLAGDGYINNYGISNALTGMNIVLETTDGRVSIGPSHNGNISYSEVPNLVTHNIIGALNQTADIFRVSKFTGNSLGNFGSSPVFNVTAVGDIGIGTSWPSEKFHMAGGRFFLEADDPGQWSSTAGAILRMGVSPNSGWYAGLGITRGEGVDVYDMDFYTAYGTPSAKMKLRSDGNLGIGNLNPSYLLSLGATAKGFSEYTSASGLDAIKSVTNNAGAGFGVQNLNASGFAGVEYLGVDGSVKAFTGYNNANAGEFRFNNVAASGFVTFQLAGSDKLTIANSGNIGIGTTNPGSFRLAVEGNIGARKLIVKQGSWADYVFEESHRLPSLFEVEAYIKKHKHLPDVVSAKEVEKNGLDVGENQAVLLKKIEEMTLYMIQMKKEIETQQKELSELKSQIKGRDS